MRRATASSRSEIHLSSFALLALALCVFLWGFGYKLSLYHLHRNADSRVPTAKLWLEPGSERTLHIPARAYAFAIPHANEPQADPLPLRELGRAAFPTYLRSPGSAVQSLLPSRAPPEAFSGSMHS